MPWPSSAKPAHAGEVGDSGVSKADGPLKILYKNSEMPSDHIAKIISKRQQYFEERKPISDARDEMCGRLRELQQQYNKICDECNLVDSRVRGAVRES